MTRFSILMGALLGALALSTARSGIHAGAPDGRSWDPRAAAAYLDSRAEWWMSWPNAARDRGTFCVSCHTAVPYALARPALRTIMGERERTAAEVKLVANVATRVNLWNEVAPFYPDQSRGLPKTSESRGTEAVMNALILATHDARNGALSDDTQQAFTNLWALQFTAGDMKGAWAWLNFHNEPWEASGSPYFGAALAAIAVGTAPGGYAARADVQDRVKSLRDYLRRGTESESLFNRLMAQPTGFFSFGGEFIDAGDDAALLLKYIRKLWRI